MRGSRVDSNQPAIVGALRACGASVQHLHMVGQGCPDILAGYRGVNYLIEIKDGSRPPSARKLTGPEASFHAAWRGQVVVVESVADAIRAVGCGVVE